MPSGPCVSRFAVGRPVADASRCARSAGCGDWGGTVTRRIVSRRDLHFQVTGGVRPSWDSARMSADVVLESLRGAALAHLRTLVDEVMSPDQPTSRDLIGLMEQVSSTATAIQATAMASMVDEAEHASAVGRSAGELVPDPEFVPDEVALALHCSTITAHRRVQVARDATRHPALMTMWCAGVLSPTAVRVITELVDILDPSAPATYDLVTEAADYAADHTPSQTRAWLSRRVLAADPDAAEERRQRAMAERRVVFTPGVDSMGSLWALLPGVQARQVYDTVNAVALASGAEDSRTMDQRRADALVDLVVGRAEPPQVSTHVVVSAETLRGEGTAQIAGVGPVLATDLTELILNAQASTTFRLLRTDPDTGELVAVSEHQYRPSAGLRRAVEARDVVCRFPGCRRSAAGPGTDLDHTVSWPAGPTDATNLAALCRRHHRLKHSPGWKVHLEPDGLMTWVTPGGHQFSTTPWCYSDPRAP